ncbi:hypothetical protein B4U78_008975 [Microbacterium esteraromaticum]|nr:hypothetical protein B4U78_008975 [Microbacterium esteraromaticum]
MKKVLLDQVIHTDYGQFDIVWNAAGDGFDGDADRFFAQQVNGWVGAAVDGDLYIVLARRSGGSTVHIELHAEAPSLGAWDDIVEVSVAIPEGAEPRWQTWAGESAGPLPVPAGSYRVRVSASGRDAAAADEFSETPLDSYLIQFWPAESAPDTVVATGSSDAAYWNEAWGGRR